MHEDEAKKIISDNIYMTIATSSNDGEPWISPVYFNFDAEYNLYWISNKESHHSELVRQNPRVAIVVFNSKAPNFTGDGVYFRCRVSELESGNDIQKGIDTYYGGRHVSTDQDKLDTSNYSGTSPWRIYRAMPTEISKLGEGKEVDGYWLDSRVIVELNGSK